MGELGGQGSKKEVVSGIKDSCWVKDDEAEGLNLSLG